MKAIEWALPYITFFGAVIGLITGIIIIASRAWKPFEKRQNWRKMVEKRLETMETRQTTYDQTQVDANKVRQDILVDNKNIHDRINDHDLWISQREEAIKTYYRDEDKKEKDREKMWDVITDLGKKVYKLINN